MLAGVIAAIAVSGFTSFASECERIPDKVLRLHIIADSDSLEDQAFKYELRDYILEGFAGELSGCDSLESALEKSGLLLEEIEIAAREFATLKDYKTTDITAQITEMYFTTRVYDSAVLNRRQTLPAGNYTALRITIGEGKGENWWCVMFPLLCIPACTETDREGGEEREVPAINLPESVTSSPKVKFAVFEFLSGLFKS